MRRTLAALAIGATALLLWAGPAQATEDKAIPVQSDCNQGWYVNPDEGDLLPTQTEAGLLFDGPSLVHHATDYTLAEVPTDGAFTTADVTGVPPLFKLETTSQYSTVNKTADGKWWSSKIAAADPGGQSNPVNSPADLIGKWSGYTADTKVFSFGVGYAKDAGNKATVTSVTFAGETYDLTCKPPASPSPSVKPSPSKTAPAVGVPTTTAPTTGGHAATLPVTGASIGTAVGIAAVLLAAGTGLFFASRRRRTRFTA